MKLIYSPGYLRAYRKLTPEIRELVDKQCAILAIDPHYPSLRTHKRRGEGEVWQARITGNYRLFFTMEGDTITLLTVGPHEK